MGEHYLKRLFQPSAVAVFGASERPGAVGTLVFRNMCEGGFSGDVYPINLKRESVQGEHTLDVRVYDRAGNQSSVLSRRIVIDVLPPTDELTSRTYLSDPPHIRSNETITLTGVANDAGRLPLRARR